MPKVVVIVPDAKAVPVIRAKAREQFAVKSISTTDEDALEITFVKPVTHAPKRPAPDNPLV